MYTAQLKGDFVGIRIWGGGGSWRKKLWLFRLKEGAKPAKSAASGRGRRGGITYCIKRAEQDSKGHFTCQSGKKGIRQGEEQGVRGEGEKA